MDELVKRLRTECTLPFQTLQLMREAADAIEELSHDYEKLAEDFNGAVELLHKREKPRWIPVTERLPERFKRVLTVDKYGVITFNWISGDGKNWSTGYHITHWMPLPPAPKEE